MQDLYMSSDRLQVVKKVQKTRAEMFKDLEVGDIIVIHIKMTGYCGYGHQPYVTILNLKTGQKVEKTFRQLRTILTAFEFEPEEVIE